VTKRKPTFSIGGRRHRSRRADLPRGGKEQANQKGGRDGDTEEAHFELEGSWKGVQIQKSTETLEGRRGLVTRGRKGIYF